MNTQLVDYGIQTEESDIRAHVCVTAQRLYVYPTIRGIETIRRGNYKLRPAFQNGIKTAEGYLVPPKDIKGCREVEIPVDVLASVGFHRQQTETQKGQSAVDVVFLFLRTGRFPFFCDPDLINDLDLQVKGTDVLVRNFGARIQVKCDFEGGPKSYGGTGNLYLQIRECNPFRKY